MKIIDLLLNSGAITKQENKNKIVSITKFKEVGKVIFEPQDA